MFVKYILKKPLPFILSVREPPPFFIAAKEFRRLGVGMPPTQVYHTALPLGVMEAVIDLRRAPGGNVYVPHEILITASVFGKPEKLRTRERVRSSASWTTQG